MYIRRPQPTTRGSALEERGCPSGRLYNIVPQLRRGCGRPPWNLQLGAVYLFPKVSESPQQGFPRRSDACWCQFFWLTWHQTSAAGWCHFLCLSRTCLLGFKLSFFSGSESDVRECGLWLTHVSLFRRVSESRQMTLEIQLGAVSLFRRVSESPQQSFQTTFLCLWLTPSAGCCFPLLQGFRKSTTRLPNYFSLRFRKWR